MFAYCGNNPITFTDPTGTYAQIWPIMFGDHNPGYIHYAVQMHIITKYYMIKKEFVLPGVGRADIYKPTTSELWEIKHGGSSSEMIDARMILAEYQVKNYVSGAKAKLNEIYHLGHAGAFNGEFIINCDSVSYLITYDTPTPGVILYYVKQLKKQKQNVYAVYPSKEYNYTEDLTRFAIGVGCAVLIASMCDVGLSDQVQQKSYAY